MMHRYFLCIWLLLFAVMLIPTIASACPSCNLIEDPITQGFNWSILFLMAMPFTVVALIGGGVFYTYKRANKENDPDAETDGTEEI